MAKQKWTVALHGPAAVRVEVEADSYLEATRAAIKAAPPNKHVSEWTPVMASRLPRRGEGK